MVTAVLAAALQIGWLTTPVPREDLRRFVADRSELWAGCEFNNRYRQQLTYYRDHANEAGKFGLARRVQEILDETERRYMIWSAAAFAWPPDPPPRPPWRYAGWRAVRVTIPPTGLQQQPRVLFNPTDWTDIKFRSFRGWLGREAYLKGRLPPPVPLEFFTEVERGQVPVTPGGPYLPQHAECPDG